MFRLMHKPAPAKASLPDPSYHWTTRKAAVFLGALAERGLVAEAARQVGMSRQSAYRLRRRLGEGGTFARAWDAALAQARERRAAQRRAATKAPPALPHGDMFGIGR